MIRVTAVQAGLNHRLHAVFSDGSSGSVGMADRLFGPMFEPLRDPAVFGRVTVDSFGAVRWPNGADLDPDALHARIRAAATSATLASVSS